jgi:histone H3/H4
MNKELKEILEKSSHAIDKLQEKVEEFTDELVGDTADLWQDLKKNFAATKEKLKDASKNLDQKSEEANLQAHLGAMEAHDKLENIKGSVDEFTQKVSSKAQTELDTAALRAHLAKMEAEDFWEKKGKEISREFNESKDKVQKLAVEAASEVKDYFEKLTETLSKKS